MKKAVPFVFAALLLGSCKGSVQAEAKTGDTEIDDFDTPLDPNLQGAGDDPDSVPEHALFGARHDLTLKGPATIRCECLVVALGQPRDPAFKWADATPAIDPATQIVIALKTAHEGCPHASAKPSGASYWGYQLRGNDVEIVIENAVAGRPLTTGAIIPKPTGTGQVYLRPVDAKVPYGRGSDGSPRCKLTAP